MMRAKSEPSPQYSLLNLMIMTPFPVLFSYLFTASCKTRLNFAEVHNYKDELDNISCSHTSISVHFINHHVKT